jgi:hypothetical protein
MKLYNKSKFENLLFKFDGSESIETNYSQSYQDMFVLSVLNGKRNGIYLEVGAYEGIFISNTYLLEKKFGWKGLSIDIEQSSAESFRNVGRENDILIQNALDIDYLDLLIKKNFPSRIDYLQLDIEPQMNTLECLKKIPFDKFKFSVITYETDYYDPSVSREESHKVREESRKILESNGYELLVGNVCNISNNDPFEDWYVDPTVIDPEILKIFRGSREYNDKAENYMLNVKI